jgi:UDP-N-acetylmuramoyl-tripeptide--D-alanyl-D-alanine ligase
MMRLSQAAQALDARVTGEDVEFTAVNTDSRSIQRGDLFIALHGERFDGHAFVAQAAAAGAAAALVEQRQDSGSGIQDSARLPLIVVQDTLQALGRLGNYWRRQFAIPLVALTGSNGKTTVKEMLASIMRTAAGDDAVLATHGNLNNHIGVPLTLCKLRSAHRYAVIEMGMNHAGELSALARFAEPEVALINNAGAAHIENFGSTEAIARAKSEIFEGLKAGGCAVFGADERYAPMWRERAAGRRQIEFALDAQVAVTATYKLRHIDSEIVIKTPLGEARAVVPAPGLHNVKNALAASAAATALDIPVATVAAGLARFGGVNGRLQRKTCRRGATLIDDTYNANPDSMRAAIDVLAQYPAPTVLVLGDMGELGEQSAKFHREIGAYAKQRKISRLFTLGDAMREGGDAFGPGARHFSNIEDMLAEIEPVLAPETTLLVKGSRFMRMERVVAALTGEMAGGH